MLTKKQVNEIREFLHNSNSPLFLFDNDPDGLCSFLLLQKYIGKGKGFPIKSFPDLSEVYFRKIEELNPDCLFILDKPTVSKEFFERVHEINLPIIWIDHHETDKKKIPKYVNYYNPLFNRKKTSEPVTALCYQINNDKSLMWLAVAGCVSDKFLPDFYEDFSKEYPDLSVKTNEAFDVFYKSPIGKAARIFSFALKDRTTNVVSMIRFLIRAKTPYEVLEDTNLNHSMHRRFEQIESKFQKFVDKASEIGTDSGNLLFFQYGGDLSISSDIANALAYKFPEKFICVVYIAGIKANISVRGKGALGRVLKAIGGLEGATGGGHEEASGAQVKLDDLKIFRERLEESMR